MNKNESKYFNELARTYPNRSAVLNEIINLNAILNLPKGTEHFMSDLHGEHQAFSQMKFTANVMFRIICRKTIPTMVLFKKTTIYLLCECTKR